MATKRGWGLHSVLHLVSRVCAQETPVERDGLFAVVYCSSFEIATEAKCITPSYLIKVVRLLFFWGGGGKEEHTDLATFYP